MNIETKQVNNNLTFKVVNGTCYDTKTDNKVIEVLETARAKNTRIQFDYGYTDLDKKVSDGRTNGQSWGEVNDVTGYVGRSTGTAKIPILLFNSRSIGGGAILTHCIVRIVTARGKKVLYSHPTFKPYDPSKD